MGTIPNSSLPFNDNAVNGDNVDYNAWNQAMQVIQLAVNDNQSQINAIKNAQQTILVAHGVAYPTNPAPSAGQLFYRDDLSQLKMFNGTLWEDVESVVATANGLSINGVTYNLTTGAVANTIALRDATGSLTAQSFHGNADTATNATTATNANNLNNQPPSYYLAATAQATDSAKLNGQLPSYYAAASSVKSGYEFEVASLFRGIGTIFYGTTTSTSLTPGLTYQASSSSQPTVHPLVQISSVSSSVAYYYEACFNPAAGYTASCALWDMTAGAIVANSTISSGASSGNNDPSPIRSSAITLVAGHVYAPALSSSNTSVNATLMNARIVGVV